MLSIFAPLTLVFIVFGPAVFDRPEHIKCDLIGEPLPAPPARDVRRDHFFTKDLPARDIVLQSCDFFIKNIHSKDDATDVHVEILVELGCGDHICVLGKTQRTNWLIPVAAGGNVWILNNVVSDQTTDGNGSNGHNFFGGRLAKVSNLHLDHNHAALRFNVQPELVYVRVRPNLSLSDTPVVVSSPVSGSSRPLSLVYSPVPSVRGILSVSGGFLGRLQCPFDQQHPDGSHNHRDSSREEHPKRPERHFLLGTQIAYFVIVGALACLSALLGYKIADSSFDALYRGQKARGVIQFWLGILVCCGLTSLIIWGGFHLSFIWWFNWLL